MSIFTGLIVYFLTFWTVLFAILPWGNQAETRAPEEGISAAPITPRIKQKFIATAIVSAVIWVIIFTLVEMKIIDYHAISAGMVGEDYS